VEVEGHGAVGQPVRLEEDDPELQTARLQELQAQRRLPPQPSLIASYTLIKLYLFATQHQLFVTWPGLIAY